MTDFGVLIFPTAYSISPAELARAAEARGFESIFFPEHTHIPACRTTPCRSLPRRIVRLWAPCCASINTLT